MNPHLISFGDLLEGGFIDLLWLKSNQREELPNICPLIHTEADIGGIPPVVKHSRRPCGYFDI
jgi:hypothetical protein